MLDRFGRCLKLTDSSESISCHEFASQFGLEFFIREKPPNHSHPHVVYFDPLCGQINNWIRSRRTEPTGWRSGKGSGCGVQVYEFKPHAGNNVFFHFYCLRLTRLLINPRNIIMIFNINSTCGQTRFLTCVARVTCLVHIIFITCMQHKLNIILEACLYVIINWFISTMCLLFPRQSTVSIVIVGTTLLCSDIYRCSFVYIVMCRSSHRPCLVYVSLDSVVGLAETFPCWQTYHTNHSFHFPCMYIWMGLPTWPSVHLHFSNCSDIFCFVCSFHVSEPFQPTVFFSQPPQSVSHNLLTQNYPHFSDVQGVIVFF